MIPANAKTIRAIPLKLKADKKHRLPDVLEIRGEIFMTFATFDRINAERDEQGLQLFANPRNFTAGTLKQLNPKVTAARDLRYRFFFSLLNRGTLDKIVTGHTADDQAETVLLRLLRGSGTRGLGGIYPALGGGKILRPFLSLTRNDIERELEERNLAFRTDSTNRELRFQRNRIRHELLPLLKKNFNPEIARLLAELSDRARDDEETLEQLAHARALPWRVREGKEEKIPVRALVELPAAIQRRVLRQMVEAVKGDVRGITHRHLESLRTLAEGEERGRKVVLPAGVEGRRVFD